MSQSIPLKKGRYTLVDDIDFSWLTQWRWRLSSSGYAVRSYTVNGKEVLVSLHREIMQPPPDLVVDHIDHNRLNNTRSNLRVITQQQNLMNRRLFQNNTTGFKGVTHEQGKWRARIDKDGQAIYLGAHADIKTAALVYDCAAIALYGEAYVYLNLPRKPFPPEIEALVAKYLAKSKP
jgi:hypothetical protein